MKIKSVKADLGKIDKAVKRRPGGQRVNRNTFVLSTFWRGSFRVNFLENEIVGFDENLAVVSLCDVQLCLTLQ